MISFIRKVWAKYQIEAILSKEEFGHYHDAFFNSFDRDRYKKIIKQLVELFKKLNNGKPKTTVIVDFGGGVKPLKKIDLDMIEALKKLGYEVNDELYSSGIVFKKEDKKTVPIMDILKTRASKIRGLEKMKLEYEKNKNEKVKQVIDFYEEIIGLRLLDKNGKIDISRLAIYQNKKAQMVFSYNLRAIASQSTDQGWDSCMDLSRYYDYGDKDGEGGGGRYVHLVGAGASAGTFVCYLVKAGDDFEVDNPTARVLFKPYFGRKTGDVLWKCDKIYGQAPVSFRTAAQAVIDRFQKPKSDTYHLTPHTYDRDSLETVIYHIEWENLSQKELYNVLNEQNFPEYQQLEGISRLKDHIYITKLLKAGRFHSKIWSTLLDKIKNQATINKLALDKDLHDNFRAYAISKVTNKNILQKLVLDTKEDDDIRFPALEKLGTPKDLAEKLVLNKEEDLQFRRRILRNVKIEPKILEKIILDPDERGRVIEEAIEKIPENSEILITVIRDENNKYTRDMIREAVGKIKDPQLLEKLISDEKIAGTQKAWLIEKTESLDSLKKIIADKDHKFRNIALQRAMSLGYDDYETLKEVIQDPESNLHSAALRILADNDLLTEKDQEWCTDALLIQWANVGPIVSGKIASVITDQKLKKKILSNENIMYYERDYVLEMLRTINDDDFLYNVVILGDRVSDRYKIAAMETLKDQKYLEEYVLGKDNNLKSSAIYLINSIPMLNRLKKKLEKEKPVPTHFVKVIMEQIEDLKKEDNGIPF